MCALDQSQCRTLLAQSGIGAVDTGTGQQKVDAGSVFAKYPGGPEKIGMIFHGVIAPDQTDEQRVLRQTQFGTNHRPGIFRRGEIPQLEPIRDNRPLMLTKTQMPLVKLSAHHRVGDYFGGQSGKPGADPDRRGGHEFFLAQKVMGAPNVPYHGRFSRQTDGGRLRRQVAVVHPTLQQVRLEASQQACQPERGPKAREAGLHAATEDRYLELGDASSSRPIVGEGNHQRIESRPVHPAQELVQHGFGATRA